MFNGFTDVFSKFAARFPERSYLLLLNTEQIPYTTWFSLSFISMMAFMFLPRQFHIMVIENSNEDHIRSAMWRLPAYLFLINIFVIPIALGGLLVNGGNTVNADYFVLNLPLQAGHHWMAMFVFIGGFSAAAGMVMVSSVALATMILNHLVMPVILRLKIEATDISGLLINIKRLAILAVIFLGYLYYRIIGESYALVNIGFISFIAAAQFAPSLIGGLYWKRANLRGATVGLDPRLHRLVLHPAGALLRPLGMDAQRHPRKRPLRIALSAPPGAVRPERLRHLDPCPFLDPLLQPGRLSDPVSADLAAQKREPSRPLKFVDAFGPRPKPGQRTRISRAPTIMEFVDLMTKFIGEKQAHAAVAQYLGDREIDEKGSLSEYEIPGLKRFTERTLAGSVGAAPARIIIENYLAAKGSRMEDVFDIFGTVTLSRTASREQLGVLYEAARVVASGSDLQSILDRILDFLVQQFKFDLCVIRILDEEKMALTVRSQRGMSSEHLGESERELSLASYIGSAFLTNSVTVINDTDFMEKPFSAQIIHREGIKSFAHAPITIEGEPVGVISAFSKSAKGIFTDEFIELFKSIAGQVGVAWRNARQTTRLIEAREQERELKIAKTIQLGLLPVGIPEIQGLSLAGTCVPAKQVGGDYYDFLPHGRAGPGRCHRGRLRPQCRRRSASWPKHALSYRPGRRTSKAPGES